MKIIVVGCGKIGETIIHALAREGHDVVAVDHRDTVLEEITNRHDVMCVCGNGADTDTLAEAGVARAELFIAVTGVDELNMLSCFLARRMGAAHTIARIRNPEYNDNSLGFMKEQLGLSMAINPDLLAAQELYHMLKFPNAVKVESFSRRTFEMIELLLREDSPFVGLSLMELRSRYKANFLVCVVQRASRVVIPHGDFTLRAGDKIGLTATPAEIMKLFRAMGIAKRSARDVMILGGSRTAFYLAKRLSASGTNVKIIDMERTVCHKISELLPNVNSVWGDGTHQELLLEEGLRSQDAFVALTGMDEANILLSYFAASQKVPKVIAKVNREEMCTMAERVGLDTIVSPREIVVNVVLRYARALQSSMGSSIEALYQLMDAQAEALEFIVQGESEFTGIPLKNLQIKPNILIAGIIRGRTTIIPAGDDQILPGDHVVIIAADQRLGSVRDILR